MESDSSRFSVSSIAYLKVTKRVEIDLTDGDLDQKSEEKPANTNQTNWMIPVFIEFNMY